MHFNEYVALGISTKSCQMKFVLVHVNAFAHHDDRKLWTFLNGVLLSVLIY